MKPRNLATPEFASEIARDALADESCRLRVLLASALTFPLMLLTFVAHVTLMRDPGHGELFVIAIILCAAFGGLIPGLVATALAGVAFASLAATPLLSLDAVAALLHHEIAFVALIGIIVSVLSETMHRSRQRAVAMRRQLTNVVATAPGILYAFRLDRDGTTSVPFASAAVRSILGLDATPYCQDASPVFALMPPDDAARVQEQIATSARDMSPYQGEFRIRRPDGSLVWVEARSVPTTQPDGSILWYGFMNDVTERKRIEQALRTARETLQLLIEQAPVSMAMLDTDLRYLAASRRWVAEHGRNEPDLVGRHHYEVCPDIPDKWREVHRDCLGGTAQSCDEDRWVQADGSTRWSRWAVHPWRTGAGEVGGIIIFTEDITARKEAAERLRESERRYHTLIQHSPDAIIVTRQARVTLANDAAARLLGATSAADVVGRDGLGMIHPDDRPLLDLARRVTWERGDSGTPLHHRVVRDDGSVIEVETMAALIDDVGASSTLIIVRDVTERRRAEQALRASEERFRQLAESIREVFWLSTPGARVMDYVSPAYETIWGRSRESLHASPLTWLEAIHEFDRERVEALVARQAHDTYDTEYRVVRPDGTIRWIHDRAFPVHDGDGNVVRVAGVAEDITERRQLELQLRQAQKLESIGLLAGGVAHDFNNWLTVITANGELLRESLRSSTEEAGELVAEICEAGAHAAGLTRQLLALSRQQVLEPRVVDLNEVVADTEKLLKRLIGEDVELKTSLDCSSKVLVDPGHLSQVLMNLAVNARDAMPTGGTLSVTTQDVVIDEAYVRVHPGARLGHHVMVRVTDTGTGMTPEVRARAFDPFFTTKGLGHGTGLGLSVVLGIIEQSDGWMDIETEVGNGTTVVIVLAAVDATTLDLDSESDAQPARGTETILLVEDESVVRRVAARALVAAGYTVIEAEDGVDALARFEAHPGTIDMVVTDVVMPRMGGRQFVNSLPGRVPVLYTSGYLDDAVVRHGVLQAEVNFLQKPYTARALVAKVRQALEVKLAA